MGKCLKCGFNFFGIPNCSFVQEARRRHPSVGYHPIGFLIGVALH